MLRDYSLLYVMEMLIDNQESWCRDDEYYDVGLRGGGGVGMIIIFVSLAWISLCSPQAVQPSPVLPNNKYGNTHHSSHNNTWSDNNTATAMLKYVWQHVVGTCLSVHAAIRVPCLSIKGQTHVKLKTKGDPVSNVILALPCLTTISHCSKLNVLKPSSFQECLKVDIIGK